jgi:hypothetical protein
MRASKVHAEAGWPTVVCGRMMRLSRIVQKPLEHRCNIGRRCRSPRLSHIEGRLDLIDATADAYRPLATSYLPEGT